MAEIGIIASVAGIAQAGVQLSQSLYHIANRLVNAPKQVAEVADELTLLSNIFQNLGETLNKARKLCKEDIIRHAESILRRFESLQKDVTELVKKIKGIEQLKYAFGMSSISDLMAKIEALKSSMCLLLSTMHVAMQAQKSKRYGNLHQRYSSCSTFQVLTILNRSQETKYFLAFSEEELAEQSRVLAEAYVESVRHAIIRLKARARKKGEKRKADDLAKEEESLAFRHWSESLDETAHWLFGMVFAPYQRARGPLVDYHGHARTIKSAKGDAPASDSDDKDTQTRPDLVSKLSGSFSSRSQDLSQDPTNDLNAMTNTKEITNELLGTWTKLNKHQIEDSASWSALTDHGSWSKTLNKLIRACIDDDEKAVVSPYQSEGSFEGHPNFTALRSKAMGSTKPANTTRKLTRPSAPSPPPRQLEKQDNEPSIPEQSGKSEVIRKDGRPKVFVVTRGSEVFERSQKVSDGEQSEAINATIADGDGDSRTVFTIATSVPETSTKPSSSSRWTANFRESELTDRVIGLPLGDGDKTEQLSTKRFDEVGSQERLRSTTKKGKKGKEAVAEEETSSDPQSLKAQFGSHGRQRNTMGQAKRKASNAAYAVEAPTTKTKAEEVRREVGANRGAGSVSRPKSNLSARFMLPHAPTKQFTPNDDSKPLGENDDSEDSVDGQKLAVPYGHYLPYSYPSGNQYPPSMSERPRSYYPAPYAAPERLSSPPSREASISGLKERLLEAKKELERNQKVHVDEVAALRQSIAARDVESAAKRDQKIAELEALINRQMEESQARQDTMDTKRIKLITELDAKLQSAVQEAQAQAMIAITKARKEDREQYEQNMFAMSKDLTEANQTADENRQLLAEAQKKMEEAQTELEAVRERLYARARYDRQYFGRHSVPSEAGSSSEDSTATETQAAEELVEEGKGSDEQGETAPSSSAAESPSQPKFIVFPSREGWGLHEKTELNSSLEKYGFKPLFEDDGVNTTAVNTHYLQRMESGGCSLRGTLFWEPTRSPTLSEVYRSLLSCGWRPLYMRANSKYFGGLCLQPFYVSPTSRSRSDLVPRGPTDPCELLPTVVCTAITARRSCRRKWRIN